MTQSTIRHLLTVLAGWLGTKADAGLIDTIAAIVCAVVAIGWSYLEKKAANGTPTSTVPKEGETK